MKRNQRFGMWTPAVAVILSIQTGQPAFAQSGAGSHWVATWATAQQQPGGGGRGGGGRGGPGGPGGPGGGGPVGAPGHGPPGQAPAAQAPAAPAAAAVPAPGTLVNQTARMIVRTTIGGSRIRVEFSNAFGAAPLDIGTAHVALRMKDSAIVAGSDRSLMFNGKPSARILVGATLLSDPVDLTIPKLADLAISVYVPGDSGRASGHSQALSTPPIFPMAIPPAPPKWRTRETPRPGIGFPAST